MNKEVEKEQPAETHDLFVSIPVSSGIPLKRTCKDHQQAQHTYCPDLQKGLGKKVVRVKAEDAVLGETRTK